MEDEADIREQLFHNTVRENIVSKNQTDVCSRSEPCLLTTNLRSRFLKFLATFLANRQLPRSPRLNSTFLSVNQYFNVRN